MYAYALLSHSLTHQMSHCLRLALHRISPIPARTLTTSQPKMSVSSLDGVWPVMLTPFKPITSPDKQPQVDYEGLDG